MEVSREKRLRYDNYACLELGTERRSGDGNLKLVREMQNAFVGAVTFTYSAVKTWNEDIGGT